MTTSFINGHFLRKGLVINGLILSKFEDLWQFIRCCHTAYHLGPAPGSLGALKEMRVNNENSSEKTWKTVI